VLFCVSVCPSAGVNAIAFSGYLGLGVRVGLGSEGGGVLSQSNGHCGWVHHECIYNSQSQFIAQGRRPSVGVLCPSHVPRLPCEQTNTT